MRALWSFAAVLVLASCDAEAPQGFSGTDDAGSALDQQAIKAGILPDPDNLEFSGRFETRSELGTDKFCSVSSGAGRFDIGVLAVFGPESKCEGQGNATIKGDTVHIALTTKAACEFDAHYDGVELRFPGSIDAGCAAYCSDRASLSGTHYFMIQPGDESGRKTLGRNIKQLCN